MRQCDECGEGFETLTRFRLHECEQEARGTTSSPELQTDAKTSDERPWEVEAGLEPEYDCPDCDYYKTGLSTGGHAFLDHLKDEHGYSSGEAFEIMNG